MTGSALSEAAKKQKERRLVNKRAKDAIEAYRNEKHLHGTASYTKIAEKFNINRITLSNLEKGKTRPLSEFNASKQKLTPAEEDVLVEAIILASRQGIPCTHGDIREEADAILQSRLGRQSEKVGKRWIDNFLRRHDCQGRHCDRTGDVRF